MSGVTLQALRKSFGAVDIIHGVDLAIGEGEFCVFVGPSGCGKSTLLRLVAGLEDASGGSIAIGGRDVTRVDAAERGVAMVFQSYALYPHMTVRENMGFGLRMTGTPAPEVASRVNRAAGILHLEALLDRRPRQLSGGQRQRVAIGRAIVRDPQVFLFDEPLSNLDAELRVQMRLEIAKLHRELGATMIYVTHDQVEAMTLADRIVVLKGGKVMQQGSPVALYEDPDSMFVAGFIGSPRMNFLDAVVERADGAAALLRLPGFGGAEVPVTCRESRLSPGAKVALGIRPEHFRAGGPVSLPVRIDAVENLGGTAYGYVRPGAEAPLTIELGSARGVAAGAEVQVTFDPAHACLFDPTSERRLR